MHDLKCSDAYFWMVEAGLKPFELRFNDRNYHGGDYLFLREYNLEHDRYSGRVVVARITCVIVDEADRWLKDRIVALGIRVLT
jgi:hypothetical protein